MMQGFVGAGALALVAIASLLPVARPESSDVRLPKKIWPLQYDLQITTSICEEDPDFTFYGRVKIKIQVKEPTSIIKLNTKELNISFDETSLRSDDSDLTIPIVQQDIDEEHEFLVIQFSMTLCVDYAFTLHLKFNGILSTRLTGFYRSKYIDKRTSKIKWMAVTQFEATDARRAFPCFDEPEFKAKFKIRLGHSRACNALSNMPLISKRNISNHPDWEIDEFDLTERMSTYLVSWAISELKCISAVTDHRMRVCAREDAVEQTTLALWVGPMSLQYYEKYFDVPYPLPKSDMLAIPDFGAGAMENWGLITYRDEYLLYDEHSSTLAAKYRLTSIVCHELAHQWFGNLVTLKWWSDLWLNEGFATYVAALGVQNVFPHWKSRDVQAVEEFMSVFTLDGLLSSHAISANISHPNEISQMFDDISYNKGSLLLRMTSLSLGEEVFRQGVINYLKRYQYRNADKGDLYQELTREAHKQEAISTDVTLKPILDSWTVQTGYPVINVRRFGKTLILSQNRFLFSRASRKHLATSHASCWYIPITFTTQEVRDFTTSPKAWMECPERELILSNVTKEDEWYVLNNQAVGIFKINYDLENWKLLSRTLNSRHFRSIAVMNRMQIVNDLLDFAWTADVEPQIAFRVVSYLRRESEFLPWRVALRNFDKLNLIFMRTEDYGIFMHWVRHLLKPSFERIGNPDPDDYHRMKHRDQLYKWACEVQLDACRNQTRELFAQWLRTRDPTQNTVIPIYLRSISTCMAVKYGGQKEWEFAWKFYLFSNDVTVKVEFLKALGCSSQPWILHRYLYRILDDDAIRKQDATVVFLNVARNAVGFSVAKDFLFKNIEKLHELYGPRNTFLAKWIKGMAEMMFTDAEYEEFNYFTDMNKKYLEGSEMVLSQAKEIIKNNILWHKINYQKYVSVFKNYKNSKLTKS